MQGSQLRQRFERLTAQLERSLPGDRRFYLAVAVAFGCLGYIGGASLLSLVARAPIDLAEPELPPVEGGANPLILDSAPKIKPQDAAASATDPSKTDPSKQKDPTDAEVVPDQNAPELKPAVVPDRSTFTKAENCRIWKRTFPEAAARLKPGDSCY